MEIGKWTTGPKEIWISVHDVVRDVCYKAAHTHGAKPVPRILRRPLFGQLSAQ